MVKTKRDRHLDYRMSETQIKIETGKLKNANTHKHAHTL